MNSLNAFPMSVSITSSPSFPKTARHRVLILGTDETLLRSREAILRRAGYEVRGVYFLRLALPREVREVDLVILCQTLHEDRAEAIRGWLGEKGCRAKVLRIAKLPSSEEERFCSLDGPAAFVAKVARVLG